MAGNTYQTDSPKMERLRFCSDFSHLLKLFKTFIVARDETWTPDGVIKKAHFKAIIDCDGGPKCFAMKVAHKLTADRLEPKYYRKMNVPMAFQALSPNVSTAMAIYKKHHEALHDCESAIKFMKRIHGVIVAMTSRSSDGTLSYDSDSYKAIVEFRHYLKEWHYEASEKDYHFMSASKYHGFQVTLETTIAVID